MSHKKIVIHGLEEHEVTETDLRDMLAQSWRGSMANILISINGKTKKIKDWKKHGIELMED